LFRPSGRSQSNITDLVIHLQQTPYIIHLPNRLSQIVRHRYEYCKIQTRLILRLALKNYLWSMTSALSHPRLYRHCFTNPEYLGDRAIILTQKVDIICGTTYKVHHTLVPFSHHHHPRREQILIIKSKPYIFFWSNQNRMIIWCLMSKLVSKNHLCLG
jgi:hypothetical protein